MSTVQPTSTLGLAPEETKEESIYATVPVRDIEAAGQIDDKHVVVNENTDLALAVYDLDVTQAELDAVNLKRLVWKIDLRLIPIMYFAMTLFTMDKATLSYSSIMGIRKDTGLSSDQYSWLGSIFSLGYLAANFPCALIIQKVPLSKWVVITMSIWGTVLACTAAAKNYQQLMAIRFLLGVLEASITPVFVLMTGMWYTRSEQCFRLGLWYSGLGAATLIGSPIAWAIDGPGRHFGALTAWRFLYVLFGSITVCTAIVFFFVVPDSQINAKFLTPAERVAAVNRIRGNQQGIGNRHFKSYQLKEFLLDPVTYIYFVFQFIFNVGAGALSTFGSLMLVQLGFDNRAALISTMPHGATTLVAIAGFGYLAAKTNDRTLWAGAASIGAFVAGLCLYGLSSHKWAATCSYYFQHMGTVAYILNFSLVSANTAGHTKKVLTNAVLLVGATTGSLTGPQITKNDATYRKVKLLMWICPLITCGLLVLIRYMRIFENKRRDRLAQEHVTGTVPSHDQEFLDLTDKENLTFRYQL